MKLALGIDPGKNGGVAIVGDEPSVARALIMPLLSQDACDVDVCKLSEWITSTIKELGSDHLDSCVLEKQQSMGQEGRVTMLSIGDQYGQLKSMLRLCRISFEIVRPQDWKKVVLAGTTKDKPAAISRALNKYPHIDLNIGKRKVIFHDGMADALCIAEFARMLVK